MFGNGLRTPSAELFPMRKRVSTWVLLAIWCALALLFSYVLPYPPDEGAPPGGSPTGGFPQPDLLSDRSLAVRWWCWLRT